MEGWYYLHQNGELIYKQDLDGIEADIRESPFAVALWPCNTSNRAHAWRILVEGLAAGAHKDRIMELAQKWECSHLAGWNRRQRHGTAKVGTPGASREQGVKQQTSAGNADSLRPATLRHNSVFCCFFARARRIPKIAL